MQNFINNFFGFLFIISYLGGIFLYDIIPVPGVDKIDEVCILILFLLYLYKAFHGKDWGVNKAFLRTIAIFIFYFFYSIHIHSNVLPGIIMDFFIQLKPYLAFFCAYQLRPRINEETRTVLNQLALVCWLLLIPVGLAGAIDEHNFKYLIGHPTSYAGAVSASALIYLFTSKGSRKNKLIFIGLLSIGILSGRSKFYGFFVVASAIVWYFSDIKRLRFNFKTLISFSFVMLAVLFVARNKIEFYFMQDLSNRAVETDYLARMALYSTSYTLLFDYFPFGSGFASFGTHASGVYYSPIYPEYNLDNIWGLNRTYTKFVADTYYPSLAQFGLSGLILYCIFWIYIIKKAITLSIDKDNLYIFSTILCIIGFLAIENVADAAFTGNRGVFMMLFLGYLFSNLSPQNNTKLKLQ